MISKTDLERLQGFSKGIADAGEEKYIYSLFAENEENREFKRHIQREFNDYLKDHPDENYNLGYLLDRIHHSIHTKENKKRNTVVRKMYRWYSVAAAVLLIPILISGGIWLSNKIQKDAVLADRPVTSTLFAPLGSRISFSLPDGTQGWLNSGSSLEYSMPFRINRQVKVSGEAWFDVVHDTDHPFEVSAGDSKVKVLGTKFNLSAYPEEQYLEVVLEEGKVEFFTPGLSRRVEMKPNERLVMRERAINRHETDVSKYSAWKEGKLIFRSDSMDEVARRISRWYNVNVEVADEELKAYTFRGIFQDDSLEEVIRFICMTSPIRYRVIDRKMMDDGTIQKKKVVLYKSNSRLSD